MGLDKLEPRPVSPRGARHLMLPVSAVLLSTMLLLGGEAARDLFRFDRAGIAAGELWRLASGHFVHLGWSHFALNVAGLGLVWYLVGSALRPCQWLLILGLSIATVDFGLWFFDRDLLWYAGLSGLLHGILVAGLAERLRKPDPETLVLAVLVLGKLAWEQWSGPLPGSEATSGGRVVVDSHLYGALGGAMAAMLLRIRVRPARPI